MTALEASRSGINSRLCILRCEIKSNF